MRVFSFMRCWMVAALLLCCNAASAATLNEVALHANVLDDVGHVKGLSLAAGFVPEQVPAWLTFLGDDVRYDIVVGRYINPGARVRDVSFFYAGPTWRYNPSLWRNCYAEFGSAAGLLSRSRVGNRDLGGHFQFTTHASLGRRFGDALSWRIGLRFQHTSNAGLEDPNPGLDTLLVEVGYRL